nr:GSCFA domain-containing protein [Agrobacterium rosae]MDX8315960.1 GSCFA domain-containing protein [Agrobacterium rosae]
MATFEYQQDGQLKRASRTFFRGESTNFHPSTESFGRSSFLQDYLMKGWKPDERFVTKQTPIVAFGSCFAANISRHLEERGYNVLTKSDNSAHVTKMGDGIVNSSAILQQFEWAWLNKSPTVDLWHGYQAEEFGYGEDIRLDTKRLFDSAELFIVTLGLSEIWFDEPTGEVFWRAVPQKSYDPARHKFRVATHAETLSNLENIHSIIRKFRPDAHILFSLSPIPMTATFRSVSCLTADAVSKAILRAALDELLRKNETDRNLHYMPSYEAVTRLFQNQWSEDRRHVHRHVLRFNMEMFEHFYCSPGISSEDLNASFRHALDEDMRIGMHGSLTEGMSYSEKREQRIQAKRDARIQARIAQREKSRKEAVVLKTVARPTSILTRVNVVRSALVWLIAGSMGFALNAWTEISFVFE